MALMQNTSRFDVGMQAPEDTAGRAGAGFFRPVNARTLSLITGQLALMLRTGNSLVDSLTAIAEQTNQPRVAEILEAVAQDVTGGSTLSAALARHPRVFDGFYVSAVTAGESTGTLAEVFSRIETHLQKRLATRGSLLTALIYPAIISVMAIGAVVFIVTFVMPKFVDIFEKSGVALPLPTRILMGMSHFMVSYWYIAIAAVIAIATAIYLYVKSPSGSRAMDKLVLVLPGVGEVTAMVQSSLMLRTLGTLLDAGVSLVEALDVAKDACKNCYFKAFVDDVTSAVIRGEGLSRCFAESEIMSPSIKTMVATGERTGNLPVVFNSIADHLDEMADKQTRRLSTLFEPAAIAAMGIMIGFIAISVLFPLFRLTTTVKGGPQ